MDKEEFAERVIAYINDRYTDSEKYWDEARDTGLKRTGTYRLGCMGAYSDVRSFVHALTEEL